MCKKRDLFILLSAFVFLSCDLLGLKDSKITTQGEFIYFVSSGNKTPGSQIFRYSVEHKGFEELTSFTNSYGLVFDISPDGKKLVIQEASHSTEGNLYIFNIGKKELKKLEAKAVINPFNDKDTTFIHAEGQSPKWSPNGRYIVYSYVSFPSIGVFDNYIYDTEKEIISAVEFNTDHEYGTYWSSDSERLFFWRVKSRTSGLYVSDLNGENQKLVSNDYGIINTDYSEKLIFCNTENEVHLININTRDIEKNLEVNIPDLNGFNIIDFLEKKNTLSLETFRKIGENLYLGLYLLNVNTGELKLIYEESERLQRFQSPKYYNPFLTGN